MLPETFASELGMVQGLQWWEGVSMVQLGHRKFNIHMVPGIRTRVREIPKWPVTLD